MGTICAVIIAWFALCELAKPLPDAWQMPRIYNGEWNTSNYATIDDGGKTQIDFSLYRVTVFAKGQADISVSGKTRVTIYAPSGFRLIVTAADNAQVTVLGSNLDLILNTKGKSNVNVFSDKGTVDVRAHEKSKVDFQAVNTAIKGVSTETASVSYEASGGDFNVHQEAKISAK
jgi:hypothetical protein